MATQQENTASRTIALESLQNGSMSESSLTPAKSAGRIMVTGDVRGRKREIDTSTNSNDVANSIGSLSPYSPISSVASSLDRSAFEHSNSLSSLLSTPFSARERAMLVRSNGHYSDGDSSEATEPDMDPAGTGTDTEAESPMDHELSMGAAAASGAVDTLANADQQADGASVTPIAASRKSRTKQKRRRSKTKSNGNATGSGKDKDKGQGPAVHSATVPNMPFSRLPRLAYFPTNRSVERFETQTPEKSSSDSSWSVGAAARLAALASTVQDKHVTAVMLPTAGSSDKTAMKAHSASEVLLLADTDGAAGQRQRLEQHLLQQAADKDESARVAAQIGMNLLDALTEEKERVRAATARAADLEKEVELLKSRVELVRQTGRKRELSLSDQLEQAQEALQQQQGDSNRHSPHTRAVSVSNPQVAEDLMYTQRQLRESRKREEALEHQLAHLKDEAEAELRVRVAVARRPLEERIQELERENIRLEEVAHADQQAVAGVVSSLREQISAFADQFDEAKNTIQCKEEENEILVKRLADKKHECESLSKRLVDKGRECEVLAEALLQHEQQAAQEQDERQVTEETSVDERKRLQRLVDKAVESLQAEIVELRDALVLAEDRLKQTEQQLTDTRAELTNSQTEANGRAQLCAQLQDDIATFTAELHRRSQQDSLSVSGDTTHNIDPAFDSFDEFALLKPERTPLEDTNTTEHTPAACEEDHVHYGGAIESTSPLEGMLVRLQQSLTTMALCEALPLSSAPSAMRFAGSALGLAMCVDSDGPRTDCQVETDGLDMKHGDPFSSCVLHGDADGLADEPDEKMGHGTRSDRGDQVAPQQMSPSDVVLRFLKRYGGALWLVGSVADVLWLRMRASRLGVSTSASSPFSLSRLNASPVAAVAITLGSSALALLCWRLFRIGQRTGADDHDDGTPLLTVLPIVLSHVARHGLSMKELNVNGSLRALRRVPVCLLPLLLIAIARTLQRMRGTRAATAIGSHVTDD